MKVRILGFWRVWNVFVLRDFMIKMRLMNVRNAIIVAKIVMVYYNKMLLKDPENNIFPDLLATFLKK